MCHLLNVPVYKVREVHHPYPSKVHQQHDMICIQVGTSSLTNEIFDNDFHKRGKHVLQVLEREHPFDLAMISSLNIMLIILYVHILPFIPFLTYIRDARCF